MMLKLILTAVLVLVATLAADSRRARTLCVDRDFKPSQLSPEQEPNDLVKYLTERVKELILSEYFRDGTDCNESVTALSFKELRGDFENVYLVKVELVDELSRTLLHTKIIEPNNAQLELIRADVVEHLFSPLGPCYWPEELVEFSEELAFEGLTNKQLVLMVAVLEPILKSAEPNLFNKTRRIEQLSFREQVNEKGTLFLLRTLVEWDEPGGSIPENLRHVHLLVLEPRSKLLKVESVRTDVEDETPIEWF